MNGLYRGILLLLLSLPAWAAIQPEPLREGEVIPLDGTLDHPAWQRAAEHDAFVELLPVTGAAPASATGVRILVGAQAIYVGITARDAHPEAIRAPLVRHDHVDRTQDAVTVYLDPAGRRRAAQFFRVSASGITTDGMHHADDDREDRSPDFDFTAASARNAQGYTAVFRIPYSTLRYTRDGSSPWRILVSRTVPRDQIYVYVSEALPAEALSFIATMGSAAGLAPVADVPFVQVRPNLTVSRSRESGGAERTGSRAGVDAKWRPAPEWVLDATVNPDFSQVELDVAQLSRNTRFALYYPEKRPFFLESVDLLQTPTDALYTRTVTRPRWGLRASLRGDPVSGTLLTGEDGGGGEVLVPGPFGTGTARQPGSQLAAARVRRDEGSLTLGMIASMRHYSEGRGENAVLGPDLVWRQGDGVLLRAQWLGSSTTALPDAQGGLSAGSAATGSRLYLNALMRDERHELNLTVEDTTAAFRNDSGFIAQSGVRFAAADLQQFWRNLGPFNFLAATVTADSTTERASGRTESSQFTPGLYASWAQNTQATLQFRGASRLRVDAAGPLLAERYWHGVYSTTPAAWAPLASIEYDRGQIVDVTANAVRDGERLTLTARLRPLRRLELEPRYSVASLRTDSGQVYREYAARLLGVWHFSPSQSLRLIVQSTGLDRQGEPLLGVAAARDYGRADSLTYAWRRSAGTVFYAGLIREKSGLPAGPTRGTELFMKLQFDVDEVRQH